MTIPPQNLLFWKKSGCKRGSIYLLAGHPETYELDSVISNAELLLSMQPYNRSIPGAPYHCVSHCAKQCSADIVILDLNPSGSAFNRTLIMSSHYVIAPTFPDSFSESFLKQWKVKIPKWNTIAEAVISATSKSKNFFPSHKPKFLGVILSRYRVNKIGHNEHGVATDVLSANDSHWERRVKTAAEDLVTTLSGIGLALSSQTYKAVDRTVVLGRVRNFGHLTSVAGYLGVPVPFLRRDELKKDVGGEMQDPSSSERSSWMEMVDKFRGIFDDIAETISNLIVQDRKEGSTKMKERVSNRWRRGVARSNVVTS